MQTSAVLPGTGSRAGSANDRRISSAAREFEALLLNFLISPLEKSLGSWPGSPSSPEGYQSLATQSLATGWADRGGIGIADLLTRKLSGENDLNRLRRLK